MNTRFCVVTELSVYSCAHCLVLAKEIRWFNAAYEGTCVHPACRQPIEVGQRIHQLDGGEYEHAACAKRAR